MSSTQCDTNPIRVVIDVRKSRSLALYVCDVTITRYDRYVEQATNDRNSNYSSTPHHIDLLNECTLNGSTICFFHFVVPLLPLLFSVVSFLFLFFVCFLDRFVSHFFLLFAMLLFLKQLIFFSIYSLLPPFICFAVYTLNTKYIYSIKGLCSFFSHLLHIKWAFGFFFTNEYKHFFAISTLFSVCMEKDGFFHSMTITVR